MPETRTITEEIQITADKLIDTVTDLLHEGNVRHIVVKNAEGQTVVEFPVTIGVVGLLIAPIVAAVGAIAVYAADFTVVVTREEPVEKPPVQETARGSPSPGLRLLHCLPHLLAKLRGQVLVGSWLWFEL